MSNKVNYGLETVLCRTPLFLANLPKEYKLASYLGESKRKVKDWKCEAYVCWLCQTYHQNIGYI